MPPHKIEVGKYLIEVHINWLGVQSVVINGQIVSRKFSYAGTDHVFTLFEEGLDIPYVLTTKVSSKDFLLRDDEILVDLRKDGELISGNLLIRFLAGDRKRNKYKTLGIRLLNRYEIKKAIDALNKGLEIDSNDPEIYFYLACCYSLEEKKKKCFEHIKMAVENNLNDKDLILNHDMLAFIRVQKGFEEFIKSNFVKYDKD